MTESRRNPVPLVDLAWQRDQIADEVDEGFRRVLANTSFILGEEVSAFETEYAGYCGSRDCVGVGNGTDAVELALRAARIGEGDEVIIPANTFVATAEAVLRAGATPVIVDCGDDYLLDIDRTVEAATNRTKAVIPVHLYGQLADVAGLRRQLGQGICIIEDAAQSQGAIQAGLRSGALGDIAATSFYPGKNLGAYGDAGAVTTSCEELAEAIRLLRNHGGTRKYEHRVLGTNSRLDSLQAVVLRAKLRRLDAWNDMRRAAAQRYTTALDQLAILTPTVLAPESHVWHLYVVQVDDRDAVLAALQADGIGAGIHYPDPIHQIGALKGQLKVSGSLSTSERLARTLLSLPIYPGITEAQQGQVVDSLASAVRGAMVA